MEMLHFQSWYYQLKNGNQDKVLKTFKTSSDCHIKICQSLKRKAIFKIHSTIFRRTYVLSVGFKIKPLRKTNSHCAVKLAERSNRSFSVYLMNHLFQTSVFFHLWQWNEIT